MRASEPPALSAVFRQLDITPDYPVSLLGYFNDRVSTGVLDPLACRLAGFAAAPGRARGAGVRRLLFVQIDTCLLDDAFAFSLRRALRAREHGAWAEREVLAFASHTHTAPALARFYEAPRQDRYASELTARIAAAAGEVARALAFRAGSSQEERAAAVTVELARGRADGVCFNRRWLLRNGRLLTNPPRALRAELDRPEGDVDPEVNTLLFRGADGEPRALFVSAVNHTDTVGGERISADWTGALEREIIRALGRDLPVFPLLGAQGNINHFDPAADRDQTCPAEAERLGRVYAEAVLRALPAAVPSAWDRRRPPLAAAVERAALPGRRIPAAELAEARALLAAGARGGAGEELTASELAEGSEAVRRVIARELQRQAPARRRLYRVPLQVARLGGVLFCAVPGEPFVEIGLALKAFGRAAGFALTVPLGLASGYNGYILPGESLARGGYEALSVAGRLGGSSAAMLLDRVQRLACRCR